MEHEEEVDVNRQIARRVWPVRSVEGGRKLESFRNNLSYRILQPKFAVFVKRSGVRP